SLYPLSHRRISSSRIRIAPLTVADLAHSKTQSRKGVSPCKVVSYALMTQASAWALSPVIRNASRKRASFSSLKQHAMSAMDACDGTAPFNLRTGHQDIGRPRRDLNY